jgi:hypothetical protein
MSILGDISSRQEDLRNRLNEWRSTLSKPKLSGFDESKENIPTHTSNVNTLLRGPIKTVKSEPADSLLSTLRIELDKIHVKEQEDARLRVQEKAELDSLRAEKESLKEENSKINIMLQDSTGRLQLAVDEINRLNFMNSCLEQQVSEWQCKMSTHVSNIKDMQIIKDREKDLLYRARKDREREVKTLKESHVSEKKMWLKEKNAYELQSQDVMSNMVMQMENLQKIAFEKINALELEIVQLKSVNLNA